MSLKVAIIIERADISLGGAERSVFELSGALSARGLDVDILAAKGQTKTKNIHILCADVGGKRTSYFTFAHLSSLEAERVLRGCQAPGNSSNRHFTS